MDRNSLYLSPEGEPNAFDYDEDLPRLPLPPLNDTLLRYFKSLKPFATEEELEHSRQVIKDFSEGVGRQLHQKLAERGSKMKNWVSDWWESYGYHILRCPLYPYTVMSMALQLDVVDIAETKENSLKTMARVLHHILEYWNFIRFEKFKPASSADGTTKFSSSLLRRFASTARIPGEHMDKVVSHFRTVREGDTPTHAVLMGKGRIFSFSCVNEDGTLLTAPQMLCILRQVYGIIDTEAVGDCVPVLTHGDRTTWARNRQRLLEISSTNQELLRVIESAIIVGVLDQREPGSYEEMCQEICAGDFHSKWADTSSVCVCFKSGKIAFVGEHSSYDGTISVHFANFVLLSLKEAVEPDWTTASSFTLPVREIKFDLDDTLRGEIQRTLSLCDVMRNDVICTVYTFDQYGKDYIKTLRLNPDSYIQTVLQWTYYLLHKEFAPTYETALMRQYYNGRTETVRSCSIELVNFIKLATNPSSSKQRILEGFRNAVNHHSHLMNEAREGRGVDRHLFGLWCIAHEANMEIPEFYSDPLYSKSGGGGNFVLSTSTLGYSVNNGYVAPMVQDGYGIFYSIVSNKIPLKTTVYRASGKTSGHKFSTKFSEIMMYVKSLSDEVPIGKL